MAQASWQDYLGLMSSLTRTLEELTQVEREKNDAASQGDLAGVEACMKREQVMSLSLRGLDQKREKLLDQLGMRGIPLRGIMDHCPDGAEEETARAADALRRQYAVFQSASEASRSTLEIHLHVIEELQKQANGGELSQDAPPMKADFRA